MPTSSQAMILFTNDNVKSYKQRSKIFTPCPVSNVDISDLLKEAYENVENFNSEVKDLKSKQTKVIKIKGYRTLLTYDPNNCVFSWRVLLDKDNQDESDKQVSRPQSACDRAGESQKFDGQGVTIVGEISSAELKKEEEIKLTTSSSIPQHLINLGFRIPGTESYVDDIKKRDVSVSISKHGQTRSEILSPAHKQRKTKSAGALLIKSSKQQTSVRPHSAKIKTKDPAVKEKKNLSPAEHTSRRHVKSAVEVSSPSMRFESLCGWDAEDNRYEDRCLPSVHMRKDVPDSEPLKCCFSLRDNENLSHKELKDFMKEQVGVDVTGLQYDPLSVRSGDPKIRNRWLATVSNFNDFDWVMEKGLYVNNEHVIFKSYDNVMEKEYNKYWYLKQVREETRKLCKSHTKIWLK